MEAINAVKKEEDRLQGKYTCYKRSVVKNIDALIEEVKTLKQNLTDVAGEKLTPLQNQLLAVCAKKVNSVTSKVSQEHKDIHSSVSKIGKVIDKNFASDFCGLTQEGIFEGAHSKQQLNEALIEHLLRQGRVYEADTLMQECGLNIEAEHKAQFIDLNNMLAECREGRIEMALKWATENREKLREKKSSLEFKLHKKMFLDLLTANKFKEALQYSKVFLHFSQFSNEIKRLMGCLAYTKIGLANSPYADLLDVSNLIDISDHLAKDMCSLLGLSKHSPLEVSLTAGFIALPTLLQIKQVMQQRQVEGMWTAKEELPVEIELGREFQFHSVFACPILRQQCGRSNPPMRLACGHVISKDATQRLSLGNKLKCPYCPMEMNPREAKKINF